jgi:hypothetical protein
MQACHLIRSCLVHCLADIIDVFGWGALGHAVGFMVLAISSLHNYGVNPWPSV